MKVINTSGSPYKYQINQSCRGTTQFDVIITDR